MHKPSQVNYLIISVVFLLSAFIGELHSPVNGLPLHPQENESSSHGHGIEANTSLTDKLEEKQIPDLAASGNESSALTNYNSSASNSSTTALISNDNANQVDESITDGQFSSSPLEKILSGSENTTTNVRESEFGLTTPLKSIDDEISQEPAAELESTHTNKNSPSTAEADERTAASNSDSTQNQNLSAAGDTILSRSNNSDTNVRESEFGLTTLLKSIDDKISQEPAADLESTPLDKSLNLTIKADERIAGSNSDSTESQRKASPDEAILSGIDNTAANLPGLEVVLTPTSKSIENEISQEPAAELESTHLNKSSPLTIEAEEKTVASDSDSTERQSTTSSDDANLFGSDNAAPKPSFEVVLTSTFIDNKTIHEPTADYTHINESAKVDESSNAINPSLDSSSNSTEDQSSSVEVEAVLPGSNDATSTPKPIDTSTRNKPEELLIPTTTIPKPEPEGHRGHAQAPNSSTLLVNICPLKFLVIAILTKAIF